MKRKIQLTFCAALFLLIQPTFSYSQTHSIKDSSAQKALHINRLAIVLGSEAALYGGFMVGLNSLWYKDYPKSSFHFFNDNAEWLQMDKAGHATTAYYVGKLGINVLDWAGMKHRNAIILGGSLGSIFLTSIEIMDGYSSEWGFSKGDILANTAGSALVIGEELLWDEQRISIKFSYSPSKYAQYRPNLLGKNFQESLLKDYNAQTYWLSANIASFLKEETKFPKWLNLALGYGADGMLGGTGNPTSDANGNSLPLFERSRQYYVSLDVELSKIKTQSKFINTLFKTIGFIKFPAPALEWNDQREFKFLPIFF
jgi:Predicted periplasmic lipoprotein (DUF2279)